MTRPAESKQPDPTKLIEMVHELREDLDRLAEKLELLDENVQESSETLTILEKELDDGLSYQMLKFLQEDVESLEGQLAEKMEAADLEEIREEIKEANQELESLIDQESKDSRKEFWEILDERLESFNYTELRELIEEEKEHLHNEINEDRDQTKRILLEMIEAIEPLQVTLDDHQQRFNEIDSVDNSSSARRKVGTYLVVIGAILNVIFLIREWRFYNETDNELAGLLVLLGVGTSASAIGAAMMSKDYY